MVRDLERQAAPAEDAITLCLINPAMLPEWFWYSVAEKVEQTTDYRVVVPKLPRSDTRATAEDYVDTIQESVKDSSLHYLGALSRGVEYAVRYIDRRINSESVDKILGWTVISSVGPRGYEVTSTWDGQPFRTRHNPQYIDGLDTDSEGREILAPQAERLMFRGLDRGNRSLFDQISADSIPQCPLSEEEVAQVPEIPRNILPLSWYIGVNDAVDNHALSAAVAWQKFGALAQYKPWGHIGPLSDPEQVAATLIDDMSRAHQLRQDVNHG